MMPATQTGWRTLAEPIYATSRYGRSVEFPAGTEIRITTDILRVADGTVAARAGFPFECEARPRSHMAACWYITAGALRFEGDEVDTGVAERPARFEDFEDAWTPEPAQEHVPSHEVEAREYVAEQNRLRFEEEG